MLANEEENQAADLDALRSSGIAVWMTEIRTVQQAFDSLDRVLTRACDLPRPDWLSRAEEAWSKLDPAMYGEERTAVVQTSCHLAPTVYGLRSDGRTPSPVRA